jgi:hypothetical protein
MGWLMPKLNAIMRWLMTKQNGELVDDETKKKIRTLIISRNCGIVGANTKK